MANSKTAALLGKAWPAFQLVIDSPPRGRMRPVVVPEPDQGGNQTVQYIEATGNV